MLLAGLVASGRLTVVITHGVSMQPLYHQGDMVIVARAPAYHVGQIVAYRVPSLHLVVLHRLITAHHGYFAFKGDNNQSVDPWHPSPTQLVGHAVLHIPQAGLWLDRATSPIAIAIATALLLVGGGATYGRRRRRRRMAAHARTRQSGNRRAHASLPAAWRGWAAVLAVLATVGVALGGLAFTTPRTQLAAVTTGQQRRVDFSYSAHVHPSAAYAGTVVRSPGPVFRKLARTVDVRFRYTGPPGRVDVAAHLSAPSGWRTQLALQPRTAVDGDGSSQSVTLDLAALEAKAAAAAAATGVPTTPVTVAIVPTVTTAHGRPFSPELDLTLTPLQLSLAQGAKLAASDTVPVTAHAPRPRTFDVRGHAITVSNLRILALILLGIAAIGAAALMVVARRLHRADAADAVSRRYGVHVVEVRPLAGPPDRPVIEVRTVADLVQLATQLGLPVLHWSQPVVDTFAVHDEFVVYRTAVAAPAASGKPSEIAAGCTRLRELRKLAHRDPMRRDLDHAREMVVSRPQGLCDHGRP